MGSIVSLAKTRPDCIIRLVEAELDDHPSHAATPPKPDHKPAPTTPPIAAPTPKVDPAPAPKPTGDDRHSALKDLARKDLPTLRHLALLKKVYDEDPQLSKKEAQLSIQSILTRLWRDDEDSALMYGRINWEPDQLAWIAFFDDMGDQTLGQYLGINSRADLPKGPAASAEGELDGDDMLGISGDDEGEGDSTDITDDVLGTGDVEPEPGLAISAGKGPDTK